MVANTWQVSSDNGTTWVDIPAPSAWTWSYYDLSSDDSGRSLDGMMHKDLAGGVKRKNECSWKNKTADVARAIMTAAKGQVFITMRYFDLFLGNINEITVYTGDITAMAQNAAGETVFEVNLNFIEQ